MMPKITKQDKIEAIKRVQLLIFDYLTEFKGDKPDNVLDEMEYIATQLETRLQRLLAPPQPKARKPKVPAMQETAAVPASGTVIVIPVPDGLTTGANAILKRSRK